MIKRVPVRRERQAVRGDQSICEADETAPVVAIQRRAAARLGLIHGARQKSTGAVDPAIVEAAHPGALWVRREHALLFALLIQEPNSRAQAGHESAAPARRDTSDVLFNRTRFQRPRGRIEFQETPAGNIDEQQQLALHTPNRRFPQLTAGIENQFERAAQDAPTSIFMVPDRPAPGCMRKSSAVPLRLMASVE